MSGSTTINLDVGQAATIVYNYTVPAGGPTPPPVATPSADPSFSVEVAAPVASVSGWSSIVTITGVAVNNTAPGATGAPLVMTEDGNASPPAYVLVGPDPTDTGAFDFTSIQYGPVP